MIQLAKLDAVTFDCWGTLIYEPAPEVAREIRADAFWRAARRAGRDVARQEAVSALRFAQDRHWSCWREGISTGSTQIAGWAFERLGLEADSVPEAFVNQLAEASLEQEVRPLDGARETLEALAARGVRRALICDTGFSPARVVRHLLERHGLLELLEVQVFSDEVGVPKPDPRMFHAALERLGAQPDRAVHVGDLRRTDIAGARGVGMGAIRIRAQYDDASECPDADAVADSHAHLRELLSG